MILFGLFTIMSRQVEDAHPLPPDLDAIARRVAHCVDELHSDPMWAMWSEHPPVNADQVNSALTVTGLTLLTMPRMVTDLQAYAARLANLLQPIETELPALPDSP